MRKAPELVKAIFDTCVSELSREDDSDVTSWAAREDPCGTYSGDDPAFGEGGLLTPVALEVTDRVAMALGGSQAVWEALCEAALPLLGSAEWQRRRGAMLALSVAAQACWRPLLRQVGSTWWLEGGAYILVPNNSPTLPLPPLFPRTRPIASPAAQNHRRLRPLRQRRGLARAPRRLPCAGADRRRPLSTRAHHARGGGHGRGRGWWACVGVASSRRCK